MITHAHARTAGDQENPSSSVIRHFRAEQVQASEAKDTVFKGKSDPLRQAWMDGWAADNPAANAAEHQAEISRGGARA